MNKFEAAAQYVRNTKSEKDLTNDQKLRFYSLYKQATTGDCTEKEPSFFNLVSKAKVNEWKKLKGMSKEEAAENYVNELTSLHPNWETN